jgi:hypothetical protein
MGRGPDPAGPVAAPDRVADDVRRRESVVLDLVLVAAVVALFALVGAVAAGVSTL